MNKYPDEYYFLAEKLEEITWALEGSCNDIDCDKYMYKELLKKRYNPILKHSYSCIPKLKLEKEAVMRLVSLKKFNKFRYKKCAMCKRKLDYLGKNFTIVSFTRPIEFKGKKVYEYRGIYVHKQCNRKVIVPASWQKGF